MMIMYLRLDSDSDGVHARVLNDGSLTFSSLGGPNSQRYGGPFSVIRIESFDGLENISDTNLLAELFRRYTTQELSRQLNLHFTTKELIRMLEERLEEN